MINDYTGTILPEGRALLDTSLNQLPDNFFISLTKFGKANLGPSFVAGFDERVLGLCQFQIIPRIPK